MAGHTTMPPRKQRTPFGDVTITSRWMRDHYVLCAYGNEAAIRWMFPRYHGELETIGSKCRHCFSPAPNPITIERELRIICGKWQESWNANLDDHVADLPADEVHQPETLREVYEHHQAHYVGLLGARTQEQYPARMQEWFGLLGADTPVAEISAEVILAARAKMQRNRDSSNTTINGKVSTLKKLLNMAHRKGWVSRAPWRDVPNLRIIRHQTRYWNAEQAGVAFSVASELQEARSRATLMLTLGIHLGLRKNEAVHLRWMDVVLDRLHPQTGLPSPVAFIQQRPGFTTKTYENRKVPISAEAVRLLTAHRPMGAKPEDYVLNPDRPHPKRGGTKRVYRYDCVMLWRRVLATAMQRGNPRIEFKEMRHSFACNCLLKGHNVEKVARWLGHKDPRMVRQHYAHLLDYDDDTGLQFIEKPINA
jgi:integrase